MAYLAIKIQRNWLKSSTILKPFESNFTWLQSGISILFCLEMALIWMKTLHFHFHNLYVKSEFQQNRASLWKALAPKPFELQTWD